MMNNLLFLILGSLFSIVNAILTFKDIPGNYTLQWMQHHALAKVCKLNLRLALTNTSLSGKNMIFENKAICHGSVVLESKLGKKGLERAAYHNMIRYKKASGHDPELICDGKGMTWAAFFHTRYDSFAGAITKFKYEKNGVYLYFSLDLGTMTRSCIYRKKRVPDEDHETQATPRTGAKHFVNGSVESTQPPAIASKQGESKTVELWAWLGPMLGTFGTIAGALITVFCVGSRKKNDQLQSSSSSEEEGIVF